MCHTTHELYDEMELWQWDEVQHNRWVRALKASHRVGVRPIWYVEEFCSQMGASCLSPGAVAARCGRGRGLGGQDGLRAGADAW